MIFVPALLAAGALLAGTWGARYFRTDPDDRVTDGNSASSDLALVAPEPPGSSELVPAHNQPARAIDHYLAASVLSLSLALAGMLAVPALSFGSALVSLYVAVPLIRRAYRSLFIEHRVRASVVDVVGGIGGLLSGFYLASAMSMVLFFLVERFC